jgi:hypothetical protein
VGEWIHGVQVSGCRFQVGPEGSHSF